MTLPYDYARCPGVGYEDEGTDGVYVWRDGCEDCQRRTSPGHPERQSYIAPPLIIVFECVSRIAPESA